VLLAPLIAVMCNPKRCASFRSCCITLRVSDFLSKYSLNLLDKKKLFEPLAMPIIAILPRNPNSSIF
jgi:hypothetical protein